MDTPPGKTIVRNCRDCGQMFAITGDEIRTLEEIAARLGWPRVNLPGRCTACRVERRKLSETVQPNDPDVWLTCVSCSSGFVFGGRDRDYFARQGFCRPRRCRDCRNRRTR
jgi:hypothetical protein